MKFLVVLSVALACAAANSESEAEIVKSEFELNPDNTYGYYYETQNGIAAHEQGNLKNTGNGYPSISVEGGYQYTAPDGQFIQLDYTADENGFQPRGSHIPAGLITEYNRAKQSPEY